MRWRNVAEKKESKSKYKGNFVINHCNFTLYLENKLSVQIHIHIFNTQIFVLNTDSGSGSLSTISI